MSKEAKRIVLLLKAEEDLIESADYIAAGSLDWALRFFDNAQATLQFLAHHPEVGSSREYASISLQGTRSWPIKGFENWLIFYQVTASEILVVRILHGARDMDNLP